MKARIMTFNVLCGGSGQKEFLPRIDRVISQIKQVAPDSLGVQEAHIEWMNALCKGLPEYAYVGVGRNDGKEDGEFSAVFYLKDKYDVVDSGNFWISETPDVPSKGWDSACIRICTWAVLKNKTTGEKYVHINTHLDHVGIKAQTEGVRMIHEKFDEFVLPTVCTGDFNVDEGKGHYNNMVTGNVGDAKFLAADTENTETFNNFGVKPTTIDFIFIAKDRVKAIKYRVLSKLVNGEYASDHFAVYADLEM